MANPSLQELSYVFCKLDGGGDSTGFSVVEEGCEAAGRAGIEYVYNR